MATTTQSISALTADEQQRLFIMMKDGIEYLESQVEEISDHKEGDVEQELADLEVEVNDRKALMKQIFTLGADDEWAF